MKSSDKTCICCGVVGDSHMMFGKNAANTDGRSNYCKDCIRAKSQVQEKKRKEYQKAYRENNKNRLSKLAADKYRRSPEVIEAARLRREAKEVAEKINKELKAQKDKFDRVWAAVSKLKSIKNRKSRIDSRFWVRRELQYRKPAWIEWDSFRDVYTKARDLTDATGIQYEVDHIYPLRSDWVCGLHTPNNLHVMKMADNAKKRNRPYGPVGEELWAPEHPSTYWPGEGKEVSVAIKAHAERLLQHAEEYPDVASALIEFYRLTGEPEHLHIRWLKQFASGSVSFDDLLSSRKRSLAPASLLTPSGAVKRVRVGRVAPRKAGRAAVRGCHTASDEVLEAVGPVEGLIIDSQVIDLLLSQVGVVAKYLDMTSRQVLEMVKGHFSAEGSA